MTFTAFRDAYDRLPDLRRPPEGQSLPGDVCKVNGRPMVFRAGEWVDLEKAMGETYCVEMLGGKPYR